MLSREVWSDGSPFPGHRDGHVLAWSSAPARPTVLGVVVEANRVHVNGGTVSAGAMVYEGDHFATEPGGMLLLRGEGAMLRLTEDSAVIVRSRTNGAQDAEAELSEGTLVFSAMIPGRVNVSLCSFPPGMGDDLPVIVR